MNVNRGKVGVGELSCGFLSLLIMCAGYIIIRKRLRSRAHEVEAHRRKSKRRTSKRLIKNNFRLNIFNTFFSIFCIHYCYGYNDRGGRDRRGTLFSPF